MHVSHCPVKDHHARRSIPRECREEHLDLVLHHLERHAGKRHGSCSSFIGADGSGFPVGGLRRVVYLHTVDARESLQYMLQFFLADEKFAIQNVCRAHSGSGTQQRGVASSNPSLCSTYPTSQSQRNFEMSSPNPSS